MNNNYLQKSWTSFAVLNNEMQIIDTSTKGQDAAIGNDAKYGIQNSPHKILRTTISRTIKPQMLQISTLFMNTVETYMYAWCAGDEAAVRKNTKVNT